MDVLCLLYSSVEFLFSQRYLVLYHRVVIISHTTSTTPLYAIQIALFVFFTFFEKMNSPIM